MLDDSVAIEARAKSSVGARDLRGLRALREEHLLRRYIAVSLEDRPRTVDGIEILPWRDFIDRLWDGALT